VFTRRGQGMFRVSVVGVVLFAVAAAGAPVPREDQRPPVPLAGSVWEGDGVVARTVYEFHEDGRMSLTYQGSRYANCGTWHQTGTSVYWETHQKYCEFEGKLTGTTVRGKSWNQPGGKWELTVKRTAAPKGD
jgi:hypothetical protein